VEDQHAEAAGIGLIITPIYFAAANSLKDNTQIMANFLAPPKRFIFVSLLPLPLYHTLQITS
jgi:hypothetical protein